MIKRLFLPLILIVSIVTACDSSAPQPTTPAPTATKIPLSKIKLDTLLVQSGDLPAGLTGAQIRDIAPAMFKSLPVADNTIFQQFARGEKAAGGVAVFLYEDKSNVDKAYHSILSGMGSRAESISEIGEKASVSVVTLGIEAVDLVLARCNYTTHIRFTGTASTEEIQAYAKRLDSRLSDVVCPNQ